MRKEVKKIKRTKRTPTFYSTTSKKKKKKKKKKILNLKELYILKVNLKETTNISKVLLLFKILDP